MARQKLLDVFLDALEQSGSPVNNAVLRAVGIWPAQPKAGVATEPKRLENALRLEGGDVLPALVLAPEEIWAS